MSKLVTVVGARPQFIKAATVSRAIAKHESVNEVIVHTGQHYDDNMSEIFFEQMFIPRPDYNLGIGGGSHGAMTGRQLEKIEEVVISEKPDAILVYGDTNSTLAGALAAAKLHIPVAHVEAGLRSFNHQMPEEINRVVVDHVSDLLFTPTKLSKHNLLREGIDEKKIYTVGDVMYDAALFYQEQAVRPDSFDTIGLDDGEFVLCTIHRAENTDDVGRLENIFRGLADSELPIILPVHPRTRIKLANAQIDIADNIRITHPVGYLEMVWLEKHCRIVATDSGGVQKEAYFHGKPCLTLRNETEWMELIELGVNRLVGVDPETIRNSLLEYFELDLNFSTNPYGLGNAAELVAHTIASVLGPSNSTAMKGEKSL